MEEVPLQSRLLYPAWVDDYAVPVFGAAAAVLDLSARAMTCVWNGFGYYGSELNMSPGKTAFLPLIHGK